MSPELTHKQVLIQKKNHPSIQQRGIQVDTLNLDINLAGDWRDDMKMMLESTGRDIPHDLKMKALNYVLMEGDLYRKWLDDFFTKWVEPVPLKKADQGDVINFGKENIIRRFGIPESLTTDQGTMFTGSDMREFAVDHGIKLINASPHYPKSNGQAEASNKVLIKILQKMMEENPRDWPRLLSETLWAYRKSKRTATGVSPFSLTFGHDAVLPLKIIVPSMRVAKQNELSIEHYNEAMIMELEELDELRIQAYNALLLQKQKVARIYKKRVNRKSFHEGEIV
ncbi:uncharacterized protein [Primulina eburnea]|uniref:uncharacterized protein n=1 Tax=Primulina eburnea TaxID=1245227 RepID=UPI003C6CB7AF